MICILIVLSCLACTFAEPIVETELGSIAGFQIDTDEGGKADIFLGIPYAKPPVGDLRFEKPVPVQHWNSVLNATSWSLECVPHTMQAKIFEIGENCLTLNVIRPTKQPPPDGFSVLFWVHGGGYEIGSARLYGYETFANAYSRRDVIVVSVQYRIGVLGFLSDGSKGLPGNLGLWDLSESLKFTHKHISAFGGNPNKITLWGLSAGGAAVGQLALSPVSRDYVYAVVEMSGSPYAGWAIGHPVVHHSTELIKKLGCEIDIKDCLKSKTLEEINAAVEAIGFTTDSLNVIRWGPRIDGTFLPDVPKKLVRDAPPKPVIMGVGNKDAGFFTVMAKSKFIHRFMIGDDLRGFGEKEMVEKIRGLVKRTAKYEENTEKAVQRVLDFYLKGRAEGDEAFYLNRYTDFISDTMFNVPAVEGAESRINAGWPVYLYSFEHFNDAIWELIDAPKGVRGSVHINEFTYMFDTFFLGKYEYTKDDITVKENLRDCLATFAKTGVATWSDLKWNVTGKDLDYISIKGKTERKTGYYKDVIDFWRSQLQFGFDLNELAPVQTQNAHQEL